MDQMRYFLSYPNRSALEAAVEDYGNHAGNVIAVYAGPTNGAQGLCMSAWMPDSNKPNSDVIRAKVSMLYLISYCRAISEQDARFIHPRLFKAMQNSG